MGYEPISHEAEGLIIVLLIVSVIVLAIIVLVKSNQLVKKISRLNIFAKLKLDINPFLPPKHYKYGGRFSLLVGYNI